MKLPVMNAEGKELRKLNVDDSVFGIEPNGTVLHQAYVRQRNNQRAGTAQTRTRGEVVGSTRKLHRQKGTGRARAGTAGSPTRVGGGTAFGPRVRDYSQAMPKKMRRLAIRSALSGKAADGQLVVIDQLAFETPKTKEIARILQNVGIKRSTLIVTSESDRQVLASTRNLHRTKVLPARYLNVGDMLNHQSLLMTVDAVRIAESLWAVAGAKVAKKRAKTDRKKAAAKPKAKAKAEAPATDAEATAEAPAKPKKAASRTRAAAKPKDDGAAKKTTTRASKAKGSTADKPKRATRAKAKATDGGDKPKTTRSRTTKKTEESEG
ncbi:MAG: 50S ribosomal protein L4 [Chloroflexi bacterium]|nr:50S ribosomal protein L4 [Chloroflexota bacterium]MCI0819902.1 50S ribosomal protein L4 [Chloroflexota bacterium]MCI0884170.1 50S ribosomal protein L4 [Chloroflexota bacterium]MCI0886387.1 50S ribosomal protein L4 [Chloroflexota bacterium]